MKTKKIKQEEVFPNTSKAKNTLDLLSIIKENGRYNDGGRQQQETMSIKENKDDRDDNNSVEPDDDIANEKDNERDISITPNILVRNNICEYDYNCIFKLITFFRIQSLHQFPSLFNQDFRFDI